jgi:hypothetical protein
MLVIPAAAKIKQIMSLGGYVYREASQGAMRFVGLFFSGGSVLAPVVLLLANVCA